MDFLENYHESKKRSTAGFWLRLQLNYDLAQIQAKAGKIRARRLDMHGTEFMVSKRFA
jgi:plasmid maintenance system antidote protein VapI